MVNLNGTALPGDAVPMLTVPTKMVGCSGEGHNQAVSVKSSGGSGSTSRTAASG
jgi:hypothetical protein